jgi:NAD(P)-dependent dehydrogenase (short-subunit alcohol dehydrogenase family)
MRDLSGKVAVVTGAASGIGLGVAEAFVTEQMKVVMADVDQTRLDEQTARLASAGAEVLGVVTDVGDPTSVERLATATLERFGAVHVICNNAGVVRSGLSWQCSLDDWELVLRVNLWGVIHGVRVFVPLLIASGEAGHVVNIASMAAVVPVAGIAPYNVSKHGVLALSETLHDELAATGANVGVSVVMPGRVKTRLGQPAGDADNSIGTNSDQLEPGFVPPAEIGRQVVAAIRAERLFVFTHIERLEEVRRRFRNITEGAA